MPQSPFALGTSLGQSFDFAEFTVTVDPGSIAATATANVDVTVPNMGNAHKVYAQPSDDAFEHGLVCIGATNPANDTVRLRITNWTGAAIDGAARTWKVIRAI